MGVLFDRASMFVFLMENACAIPIFVRSVSDRPCRNCIYFCFRSRTKTLNEIRITRVTANCLRRHPCKPRALFYTLYDYAFQRILADERSEQAKFKRAERAQHVLRCKFGADTKCWLPLGANFCGIKGNARNFPRLSRFVCPDPCDDLFAVVWARCVARGFSDRIAIGPHEMIELRKG